MNSKKKLSVKATRSFARNLKALAKKRHGIENLVFAKAEAIAASPESGVLIPSTSNTLWKVRLPDPYSGKGKRGGFRLIYAWKEDFDSVILCLIYPKSEKSGASSSELENALVEIEEIILH
jgi:mRNA-degrading endonuclease RelE of RelBE toxin-antitoxin system